MEDVVKFQRTAGKCYESKYGQLETRTEEEKGKRKRSGALKEVVAIAFDQNSALPSPPH